MKDYSKYRKMHTENTRAFAILGVFCFVLAFHFISFHFILFHLLTLAILWGGGGGGEYKARGAWKAQILTCPRPESQTLTSQRERWKK